MSNKGLVYTWKKATSDRGRLERVDPGPSHATTDVAVTGSLISVTPRTNGGGTFLTLAREERDAVRAYGPARELAYVHVAPGSDGTGVPSALSPATFAPPAPSGPSQEKQLLDILLAYEKAKEPGTAFKGSGADAPSGPFTTPPSADVLMLRKLGESIRDQYVVAQASTLPWLFVPVFPLDVQNFHALQWLNLVDGWRPKALGEGRLLLWDIGLDPGDPTATLAILTDPDLWQAGRYNVHAFEAWSASTGWPNVPAGSAGNMTIIHDLAADNGIEGGSRYMGPNVYGSWGWAWWLRTSNPPSFGSAPPDGDDVNEALALASSYQASLQRHVDEMILALKLARPDHTLRWELEASAGENYGGARGILTREIFGAQRRIIAIGDEVFYYKQYVDTLRNATQTWGYFPTNWAESPSYWWIIAYLATRDPDAAPFTPTVI